jgi:hypothetical protein
MTTAAPEITLLTVLEAAELLRLHPHTVYEKVNAGELGAVRFLLKSGAPAHVFTDEDRRKAHLLKSGAPAHVFTDEDRRKAAAVTNEIRRAKRELFEQERINRELAEMFARHEERKRRKREAQRDRRAAEHAPRPSRALLAVRDLLILSTRVAPRPRS